jgi:hypothetical protein
MQLRVFRLRDPPDTTNDIHRDCCGKAQADVASAGAIERISVEPLQGGFPDVE